ncbi:MAG: hypothetical protein HUU06_13865 [Planctomycetaceae bacterium]|nr:hypothetical protein [Planctomycetota bacterium]NUN53855.1 hypothetical protein [Planctomycetaceae bacterium]
MALVAAGLVLCEFLALRVMGEKRVVHPLAIDLAESLVDPDWTGILTPETRVWLGGQSLEIQEAAGKAVMLHLTLWSDRRRMGGQEMGIRDPRRLFEELPPGSRDAYLSEMGRAAQCLREGRYEEFSDIVNALHGRWTWERVEAR